MVGMELVMIGLPDPILADLVMRDLVMIGLILPDLILADLVLADLMLASLLLESTSVPSLEESIGREAELLTKVLTTLSDVVSFVAWTERNIEIKGGGWF